MANKSKKAASGTGKPNKPPSKRRDTAPQGRTARTIAASALGRRSKK